MFALSEEKTSDWWEVEALLDTAFGPGRTGLSSYRLREGVEPVSALCLLARDEADSVAGAIRFWPIMAGEEPALLLGPVAVHPTHQGEGLGALLIARGLERALTAGWTWVVLVGDEPYYSRFGFTRAAAAELEFPAPTNPNRVLAQRLVPEAAQITGPVRPWTEPNPA